MRLGSYSRRERRQNCVIYTPMPLLATPRPILSAPNDNRSVTDNSRATAKRCFCLTRSREAAMKTKAKKMAACLAALRQSTPPLQAATDTRAPSSPCLLPSIAVDCRRLPSIAVDCCRLLSIVIDCCRLLSIAVDCQEAPPVPGVPSNWLLSMGDRLPRQVIIPHGFARPLG